MPTPEYHARLGPSSAHRWINCPASVQMSKDVVPTTSVYAEAGRVAHAIAELKARKWFQKMPLARYQKQLATLQQSEYYDPVMEEYTDIYLNALEEHALTFDTMPFLALETSVPIGIYTGEYKNAKGELSTGTADCIQVGGDTLWVTDYKNGAGVPVSAVDNPQMMMYALGTLALYEPLYGESIKLVRMSIIQPAINNISDWEISVADLKQWAADVLVPAAEKAKSDDPGEPCPGEWCKFCPVKSTCRARAYQVLALEAFQKKEAKLLTPDEIGDVLTRGSLLKSWFEDVKDYALTSALSGKPITGYKVVEGRGTRDWTNQDAAFEALTKNGINEALLWERKPVSVAALEKALGKKTFAEATEGFVVKSAGKPALVPESDKRPAYNAAATMFKAVSE